MGGLLVLLLALLLGLFLWLPSWVKGDGARLASEALGRQVTITEFEFAPWRMGVALGGLRVAGASGQTEPMLEVQRIEAALSLRSLWFRSPVLEFLTVTRPVVRLTRLAEGHYDVDDLLARFSAPKAAGDAQSPPPSLALYNISLKQGQVLLNDKPLGRQHQLSDLAMELPFISTLDADVKVHVQPQLSGRLNGVAFGGKGSGLPFAEHREAKLDFKLDGFELAPYIGYLPKSLPLQLKQGRVDAQLVLQFQQPKGQVPQLGLSGTIDLANFALQTPRGEPWLAWRGLHLDLRDIQPLRRLVNLGGITWTGPELALARDARGQIWQLGDSAPAQPSSAPSKPAGASGASVPAPTASPDAQAWRVALAGMTLSDGRLTWRDASTAAPLALSVSELSAKLGAVAWPLKGAMPIEWSLALRPQGNTTQAAAQMSGEGSLSPESLAMAWRTQGLELQWFEPYVRPFVAARLKGNLAVEGQVALAEPLAAEPAARLQLGLRNLELKSFALTPLSSRDEMVRLAALTLDRVDIELGAQRLDAGQLTLRRPALDVWRDLQGRWSYLSMLPAEPARTRLAGRSDAAKPAS
ncbi:DUF748 domain-containing protein [Paucibacter sp. AS339]|uniref:AsmA family protein n=1 Tax=Paucibacter hankyongi TaxID=3133434 RepID=UPI0030B2506C